jgi:hypothetical protein
MTPDAGAARAPKARQVVLRPQEVLPLYGPSALARGPLASEFGPLLGTLASDEE